MALYDYWCVACKRIFEVFFMPKERAKNTEKCPKCGSKAERRPGLGGYKMNSGPSSVRPKQAGSFRKRK